MERREKEQVIADLHKQVEKLKAAVLTNYRGLNVEQMSQLRNRLREEKISFNVVKNTLMKLASEGTNLEKLKDYFVGPTAIAIAYGDPVSLAKILLDFQKTQPLLQIKAGLVEGQVTSPEEVRSLASMPPREVMLAQVLQGIQMPGAQLAGVLNTVIQQVVNVVQARVDQLEKSSQVEGGQ